MSMSFKLTSVRYWVIGLAVFVCSPAVLADSCHLERIVEVAMSVTRGGQVVVPVEINGIHVKMAIDTASSLTNIYSGATAALNLTPSDTLKGGVLHVGATSLSARTFAQIGERELAPCQRIGLPVEQNICTAPERG
jgi:hypothetical protein